MQTLRFLIYLLFCTSFGTISRAQDTLPKFSVKNKSGKIIISWINNYPIIKQISIQRSSDSAKGFRSILTVPDPNAISNGFLDSKSMDTLAYYRLFLLVDSSHYLFTVPRRPSREPVVKTVKVPPVTEPVQVTLSMRDSSLIIDSTTFQDTAYTIGNTRIINQTIAGVAGREEPKMQDNVKKPFKDKRIIIEQTIFIKRRDSVIGQITDRNYKRFSDSVLNKTKDTLVIRSFDTIVIKPVYRPSPYVFTNKDGNVTILLNRLMENKYAIKFFEEDNSPLFELHEVRESPLTLEKTNFQHAGWFYFELYENETLKERNKFLIPRDHR